VRPKASLVGLTLFSADAITVPYRMIWSWYTDRWWVCCYIWYSEETRRGGSPPKPLLAIQNVKAHPSTASVPITVLLLCGFNVSIKVNLQHSPVLQTPTTYKITFTCHKITGFRRVALDMSRELTLAWTMSTASRRSWKIDLYDMYSSPQLTPVSSLP